MNHAALDASRVIRPSILYFGTPVVLLTTCNEDGTTNITPMSSAWALGNRIVLGLSAKGKGFSNLERWKECVVNLPKPSDWDKVEKLAPLTGANPVPEAKSGLYSYAKDKFAASGFTALPSQDVQPERVAECPLQIEAVVKNMIPVRDGDMEFAIIEVEAVKVHAHEDVILQDRYIDPARWSPLIYNFRHYFGLGEQKGKSFKSDT